jgi:hypothetical protein
MATITASFWLGIVLTGIAAVTAAAQPVETPDPMPQTVRQVAAWAVRSGDAKNLPFVVVDKVSADVFVFRPGGELWAAAPALLGLAQGDDSAPGIGDRPLRSISPAERTTPAGRFVAAFGPAPQNKEVLWVDYSTALSLHPVVNGNRAERRPERLRSPSAEDNRVTFGCINVSAEFYEKVVRQALTGIQAIVYILPESRGLSEVFPTFAADGETPALPLQAEP